MTPRLHTEYQTNNNHIVILSERCEPTTEIPVVHFKGSKGEFVQSHSKIVLSNFTSYICDENGKFIMSDIPLEFKLYFKYGCEQNKYFLSLKDFKHPFYSKLSLRPINIDFNEYKINEEILFKPDTDSEWVKGILCYSTDTGYHAVYRDAIIGLTITYISEIKKING